MKNTPTHQSLCTYLDSLLITPDNIGEIRSRLMLPFGCEYNAIVRDETAAREKRVEHATIYEHTRNEHTRNELTRFLNRYGLDNRANIDDRTLADMVLEFINSMPRPRQPVEIGATVTTGTPDQCPEPPKSIEELRDAAESVLLNRILSAGKQEFSGVEKELVEAWGMFVNTCLQIDYANKTARFTEIPPHARTATGIPAGGDCGTASADTLESELARLFRGVSELMVKRLGEMDVDMYNVIDDAHTTLGMAYNKVATAKK